MARDQLAEAEDLAAQIAPALALLEAEFSLKLTELQLEHAFLARERKAVQEQIDALQLRSETAGVISFIAPALTTGALVAVRRGEHVISLAHPGMFRAKIAINVRDLSLFTNRRVIARLSLEASHLTGQVTRISALRSPLPDGSTHEVEISFDPTTPEAEPQSASCLFEAFAEAAP
ncbi:HlyD family efflux transporter periplasmic adaptor subunit [Pseudogemmobacter faecipullorum]|nr:HlyD family efflux transporter periplasmic adaptor subunit [Pseudogemmobacter faecipullorum]